MDSMQIEEMVYLLLHEVVDDIFTPAPTISDAANVSSGREVIDDAEEEEESVICELMPDLSTLSSAPFVVPVPSMPKRRRLGVSSGAHDQIMLLR
jgi:hypothetical protein